MAISVIDNPQLFMPAYNPVVYVFDSTNKGEDGFRYVVDVYREGDSSYFTRHKIAPRPDNGYCVFDSMRILETLVSHDIDLAITGFDKNPNSFKRYLVKVGEEFDGTLTADLYTSPTRYVYNGIFDENDFLDYDYLDYVMSTAGMAVFQTQQPSSVKVKSTESAFLYMMALTSGDIDVIRIDTYDSAGVLLGEYEIANPYAAMPDQASHFLKFPAGPANIATIPGGDITTISGATPIIDSSVASYKLYTKDGAANINSQVQEYVIDEQCSRFDHYRLHFLNTLGGFDSFTFTRASRLSAELSRTSMKQVRGKFVTASDYSYEKSDFGQRDIRITGQKTLSLNTDWLTEAECTWLLELVTSPVIYMEVSGELIAYKAIGTAYEEKKKANEKLFQLSLEIIPAHKLYRQRY